MSEEKIMPTIVKTLAAIIVSTLGSVLSRLVTRSFIEGLIVIGIRWLVSNTKSPLTKEVAKNILLELGVRQSHIESIESCKEGKCD